ncbi:hypothetical protein [Paenibacillus vini]|uniref:Uncharacterized protein n=1 Tax=Paenibacillus vini TaxID=1476024 RepID=A0ABQ4MH27_9BACL|nr:hypothetical protein [Paenibacillus vini]GIP55268.1 hypothetical protein J42TS3_43030 [Paenibacillus vini]
MRENVPDVGKFQSRVAPNLGKSEDVLANPVGPAPTVPAGVRKFLRLGAATPERESRDY